MLKNQTEVYSYPNKVNLVFVCNPKSQSQVGNAQELYHLDW